MPACSRATWRTAGAQCARGPAPVLLRLLRDDNGYCCRWQSEGVVTGSRTAAMQVNQSNCDPPQGGSALTRIRSTHHCHHHCHHHHHHHHHKTRLDTGGCLVLNFVVGIEKAAGKAIESLVDAAELGNGKGRGIASKSATREQEATAKGQGNAFLPRMTPFGGHRSQISSIASCIRSKKKKKKKKKTYRLLDLGGYVVGPHPLVLLNARGQLLKAVETVLEGGVLSLERRQLLFPPPARK